jgi:hypothetical protein
MVKPYPSILLLLVFSCHNSFQPKEKPITKPVEIITATSDQQARRNQSEKYCKAHQIPVYTNPTALFVDPESQVSIRTKDEVADRALALCYIGLKSEGFEQKYLDQLASTFNVLPKLTTGEKAYINAPLPSEQQRTDASWRFESLHVMLWALGFIDSLSYPNQQCKVVDDVKIIQNLTADEFRKKAKLRSKKEILDQADLILRIDWACVNNRMKSMPAPGNLNTDVVTERHHSLNWLINYLNQDWDNVSTDT